MLGRKYHCHKCNRFKPSWEMNPEDPTECSSCSVMNLVSPIRELQEVILYETEQERIHECVS